MSLTRRNDGCPQCRNRRLRCDKTEPECLKCLKKGIRCSGQGFECRFSSHMAKVPSSARVNASYSSSSDQTLKVSPASAAPARRQRRTGTSTPGPLTEREPEPGLVPVPVPVPVTSSHETRASKPQITVLGNFPEFVHTSDQQKIEAMVLPSCPQSTAGPPDTSSSYITKDDTDDDSLPLIIAGAIEPLSPQQRLLFYHFSEFIAAKMVVYDFGTNGYRDIILPLACQDETVGRAVCAVAAFHLSASGVDSRMLATAEATQHAVLTKLCRDSREPSPNRVFSMSTWVAVVVLLVGETITASSNYIQLLGMLRFLAKSAESDPSIPEAAKAFLYQQTRMFKLFGSAFTSEPTNLELLSGPIEPYLDWASLPSPSNTNDSRATNILLIRSAILASAQLCVQRMQNQASYLCPNYQLETLKDTVKGLEPSVEGAHALVWTCFVAAAESVLPEHRLFFSHRLGSLYECTRFGTIPKALELLDMIWKKQGKKKWTELVTLERPILIM